MDIYKQLPQAVVQDSQKEGMQQTTNTSEKKTDVLKRVVDRTMTETGPYDRQELVASLNFKVHYLETSGKEKVPRKEYRKTKRLTAREKKKLNLFKIDSSEQKYELFEPLYELWQDYIRDLVDFSKINAANKSDAMMKLTRADYHGALIRVARSKCPSLVGLQGIIVQETKNTFKIVTQEDKLKTIPKENSLFTFEIDGYTGTIYGRQFTLKASERIHRRFKSKYTIDL